MENGVPIPERDRTGCGEREQERLRSSGADYTYSMFAVTNAINAMQAAAELLINEVPAQALFGIYEFNADYVAPRSSPPIS